MVNSKKHLDVAILKIDICLRFSHQLRSVLSSPVPSPPQPSRHCLEGS